MTFQLEQLVGNVGLLRVLENIEVSPNGCWNWIGARNRLGYGRIYDKRRYIKGSGSSAGAATMAHRVAYQELRGPIPPGQHIHHLCRNPSCVNPEHLETVSPTAHLFLGESPAAQNARKTHCPQGHPYDGDNVAIYKDGRGKPCRRCRTCDSERSHAYHEANKSEVAKKRRVYYEANRSSLVEYSRAYRERKRAETVSRPS